MPATTNRLEAGFAYQAAQSFAGATYGNDRRTPSSGAYFVTICAWQRELLLADPVIAEHVRHVWEQLPRRFPTITLDAFVVMPNHVHFVVFLNPPSNSVRASLNDTRTPTPFRRPSRKPDAPALGEVVRTFKAVVTRTIHQQYPNIAFAWQRNYYEHIVRSERALDAIRRYIADNPARRRLDRLNAAASGCDPHVETLLRVLRETEE